MKKTTCMSLAAAAMVLAGCTGYELPGTKEAATRGSIRFSAPVVERHATRSGCDIDNNTVEQVRFGLYADCYEGQAWHAGAEAVFDGQELAYNSAAGRWEYAGGDKMWKAGRTYDFLAVAPHKWRKGYTTTQYAGGKLRVTDIPAVQLNSTWTDATGSKQYGADDFLVSSLTTTTKARAAGSGVGFRMSHMMAKLNVYASTDAAADYDVVLNELKVYMPDGSACMASYEQAEHADPTRGAWTWDTRDFTSDAHLASPAQALARGYAAYTLLTDGQLAIKKTEEANATNKAHATTTDCNLFVAPTPEGLGLTPYVEVAFSVKKGDETVRATRFAPIDNLSRFVQGNVHNVFMRIAPEMIRFGVSVSDWQEEDAGGTGIINTDFEAVNSGLDIIGTIPTALASQTFSYVSLTKVGEDANLLKEEAVGTAVDYDPGSGVFTLAGAKYKTGELDLEADYCLTIKSGNGQELKGVVRFSGFDAMSLTVCPEDGNMTFAMPLKPGEQLTYADLAIWWGDGSCTTLPKNSTPTAEQYIHTYDVPGPKTIILLSSQKDRTQKQIPEFNFSKYPTPTIQLVLRFENTNAHLLKSINSALLNSREKDLSGIFWETTSLERIDANTFMSYPNCESLKNAFRTIKGNDALKEIPAGLFDKNEKIELFEFAFAYCTALTTIPAGLFYHTRGINFKSVFEYCTALQTVPARLFDTKGNHARIVSNAFKDCTSLTSVPEGLFACPGLYDFSCVFLGCSNLEINENLFIDQNTTKQTRFASLKVRVDFTKCFWGIKGGTAPDLWYYSYPSYYTWTYNGVPFSKKTPYTNSNDIPDYWKDATIAPPADSDWKQKET